MLTCDPSELIAEHRRRIEAEAEQLRLLAQLPRQPNLVRRGLAAACFRVAVWLDAPAGYVELPEVGPEDWVRPWASV